MSYILSIAQQLVEGMKYTAGLFIITAVLAIPLGFFFAMARKAKIPVLDWFLGGYIWVMRGTPLLLQLFFFYYGLPYISFFGFSFVLDRLPACCLAFVLNYAAYFCEIFRGGILSIDKGQYEAAKVLGFSRFQTTIKIVIPQMMRVSLPAVTNECITLVKDTALITALSVVEIMHITTSIVNTDVDVTAYGVAAAFYLILTLFLTWLSKRFEKKLAY